MGYELSNYEKITIFGTLDDKRIEEIIRENCLLHNAPKFTPPDVQEMWKEYDSLRQVILTELRNRNKDVVFRLEG